MIITGEVTEKNVDQIKLGQKVNIKLLINSLLDQ